MNVTLDTPVEDLVQAHPRAIGFLARHHVVCIVCGEPYWGTLGELIAQKGLPNPEHIVTELNIHLAGNNAPTNEAT